MNNYVFYVDLPMMENNYLFRVEDTVMKAPPVQVEHMRMDRVSHIFHSGNQVKLKKYDNHSLQFIVEELKQYQGISYENCDLPIENLFFHCHNLYEVTVVLSGRGYYFVNGKAIEVSCGDVVVFNRLVPHAWVAAPGHAPQQWTFHFYPDLLLEQELSKEENGFIREYLSDRSWLYEKEGESAETLNIFREIHKEFFEKKTGYRTCINNLLINYFIHEARKHRVVPPKVKRSTSGTELEKALNYMKCNFQNRISLEDVASFVYMHPNYFSAVFKKKYGIPFAQYMNLLKLSMASELMQSTDMSVEAIAKECGFSSSSNFYRVFKEHFNTSPLQYTKKVRK